MLGNLPNSFAYPGSYVKWLSGPIDCGHKAYFNSLLTTGSMQPSANASLTIFLRLNLIKMNKTDPKPVDGNKKTFDHRDWAAGEFEQFRADVKKLADDFWGKTNFCLIPPDDYEGLDWPPAKPTLRLNIDCQFEIVWANGKRDGHASISCYRIDAAENPGFRSFVHEDDSTNTGSWTNFDTVKGCGTCGVDVFKGWADDAKILAIHDRLSLEHVTAIHEVGHLLGLPHPGVFRKHPACLEASGGDGNAPSCYKGNDAYDQANVMGEGMRLELWNGIPWWRRLSEHTGTTLQGWKVKRSSHPPRKLPAAAATTAVGGPGRYLGARP